MKSKMVCCYLCFVGEERKRSDVGILAINDTKFSINSSKHEYEDASPTHRRFSLFCMFFSWLFIIWTFLLWNNRISITQVWWFKTCDKQFLFSSQFVVRRLKNSRQICHLRYYVPLSGWSWKTVTSMRNCGQAQTTLIRLTILNCRTQCKVELKHKTCDDGHSRLFCF